jgi:hypothetical protein
MKYVRKMRCCVCVLVGSCARVFFQGVVFG